MSMRDYAFCDHGLLLNKLVDDDLLQELAENEVIESQFSFTGEAFPLNDNGHEDWAHGDPFNGETVYYLSVTYHPGLFSLAYSCMDELVKDLQRQYRKARRKCKELPKLTARQIRENVRSIQGTYYG